MVRWLIDEEAQMTAPEPRDPRPMTGAAPDGERPADHLAAAVGALDLTAALARLRDEEPGVE
jgi:hypothetical protein